MREMRVRHAEKQAKGSVHAPQPVSEEEDDMDEDEEEPEAGIDVAGTSDIPTEVIAEVGAPRGVPKPVEVKHKQRVEEATTGTLPNR